MIFTVDLSNHGGKCQTFLSESQQNSVYFDDWIKLLKVNTTSKWQGWKLNYISRIQNTILLAHYKKMPSNYFKTIWGIFTIFLTHRLWFIFLWPLSLSPYQSILRKWSGLSYATMDIFNLSWCVWIFNISPHIVKFMCSDSIVKYQKQMSVRFLEGDTKIVFNLGNTKSTHLLETGQSSLSYVISIPQLTCMTMIWSFIN